jgi:hypothetical protein
MDHEFIKNQKEPVIFLCWGMALLLAALQLFIVVNSGIGRIQLSPVYRFSNLFRHQT